MIIDVYNATDTAKLGTITTGFGWSNSLELDRSGTFSFSMPASDTKASLITGKRIVRGYNVINDVFTLIGAGVIDARNIQIVGTELTIGGNDLLHLLANTSVLFLELENAGAGVTDGIQDILALASGWTFDTVNGYNTTAASTYAKFAGESVLEAFVKITETYGENFRLGDGKEIVWLRNDTPSSGVKAVQYLSPESAGTENVTLIDNLSIDYQSENIVSRIYPFGAGNAEARLTLQTTTESAPAGYTLVKNGNESYLRKDATETTYGIIERAVSFKDIAPISNTDTDVQSASDTLFGAAKVYLDNRDEDTVIYSLSVVGLNTIVYPGETMRVVYRGFVDGTSWVDIDENLIVISAQNEIIDANAQTVSMVVSTRAERTKTDQDIITENIGETITYESHPQLSANGDVLGQSITMDDDNDAIFYFWIGAEVTTLNQVLVRFRVDKLRSTVKSVAGSSTTTAGGGADTVTSASGGGQTATGGSREHLMTLFAGAGDAATEYKHAAGLAALYGGAGLAANKSIESGVSASHSHTINAHTHGVTIGDHTHSLTPNITTVYGVFEDTAGNTLAVGDLTITVNGGSDLAGSVSSIGSGWYELDITDEVQNSATLRQTQDDNDVTFGTAVAKSAQIVSQISVRSVIQAIANI